MNYSARAVEDRVAEFGHAIIRSHEKSQDPEIGHTYTIGLHLSGLPEILMQARLPVVSTVITNLAEGMLDRGSLPLFPPTQIRGRLFQLVEFSTQAVISLGMMSLAPSHLGRVMWRTALLAMQTDERWPWEQERDHPRWLPDARLGKSPSRPLSQGQR